MSSANSNTNNEQSSVQIPTDIRNNNQENVSHQTRTDVNDADRLLLPETNLLQRPSSINDGFTNTNGISAQDNSQRPLVGFRPPQPTAFNFPEFDVQNNNPGAPDFYVYQQRKTLAQGMMDLALFSANANQLRYVFESYDRHPFFYPSVICIIMSLFLQIAVAVGLILNGRCSLQDQKQVNFANRVNNFTVLGIFMVTVVNVFISAFGVPESTTLAAVPTFTTPLPVSVTPML